MYWLRSTLELKEKRGDVSKMFLPECCGVNEEDHLTVGGCDTVELAARFGTPLYVMDEATVRRACRLYKTSFDRYYGGKGCAYMRARRFAAGALPHSGFEGLGLDVVSAGELYTALRAGFPTQKIHFHGNNKTDEELQFALNSDIGRFVVDNLSELERLQGFAAEVGKKTEISCASSRASTRTRMISSAPVRSIPSSASPWRQGGNGRRARRLRLSEPAFERGPLSHRFSDF